MPGFEGIPILMNEEQTPSLIKAGGEAKEIAIHMDALDHCRTSGASLRRKADEANVSSEKLLILQNGEHITLK